MIQNHPIKSSIIIHRSSLSALALAAVLTACTPASGRYGVEVDPASRNHIKYVMDHTTGRWVHREFEIRVDLERPLPDPLTDMQTGDRISFQLFKPGSAQTGGIFSSTPAIENGFRVWRGMDALHADDVAGPISYGVGVAWPQSGQETRHDPMEMFPLPPLKEAVPETWSVWATAAALRSGAFGWWDEVAGKPAEPPGSPEHPFQFRWRIVYAEIPGRIP